MLIHSPIPVPVSPNSHQRERERERSIERGNSFLYFVLSSSVAEQREMGAEDSTKRPLVFAYYVTGHGFGHATRVVEVYHFLPLSVYLSLVLLERLMILVVHLIVIFAFVLHFI